MKSLTVTIHTTAKERGFPMVLLNTLRNCLTDESVGEILKFEVSN